MKTETFYTSEIANRPEIVKLGFQKLFQAAQQAKSPAVHLVCSTKGNLEGHIEAVLGLEIVKALQKTGEVTVSGTRLVFHHEKSIPQSVGGSPVLVCYPTEKLLQKTEAIREVAVMILLPWVLDDIRPWLLAHGATDLLGKADVLPLKIANPVVEEALKGMLISINTSTGIVHPSDKATAIETFKTLSAGGESYDPREIGAWFVQNGVSGKHAAAIVAIAENPAGFRSTEKATWGNQALERWRANAKKT